MSFIEPEAATTILLCDDDADFRSSCEFALRSYDYDIILAENGAEGLNIFHALNVARTVEEMRHSIDCIVTDFQMGTMDGLELVQRIRTLQPIPLIIMTGKPDVLRKDAREQNIPLPPTIEKPFEIEEFLAIVEAVTAAQLEAVRETIHHQPLAITPGTLLRVKVANNHPLNGGVGKQFRVGCRCPQDTWLEDISNRYGNPFPVPNETLTTQFFSVIEQHE